MHPNIIFAFLATIVMLAIEYFPTAALAEIRANQSIQLTPGAGVGAGANELINLGIPFAPGVVTDAGSVRILDESGAEVPAYVAPSILWPADGSVRAVKVQFSADLSGGPRSFSFDFSQPRTQSVALRAYDEGITAGKEGFPTPRVLATLTPQWMTASRIAGAQTVMGASAYDNYVKEMWAWAKDTTYTEYDHWLFDRVSTIAKIYIRTGDPQYLQEAFNSYRFYMDKIKTEGEPGYPDCAGGWEYGEKSPCDNKYIYIEPVLLMLALTGDDTQHDAGKIDLMVQAWVSGGWSDILLELYSSPDLPFTERVMGLRLSAFADAYALTGDSDYRELMETALDHAFQHQTANPDGFGNDGCWRHSWALHEGEDYPGNTADDRRCSPWMSAMVISGLYKSYLLTADPRIEEMVRGFGQFMENYGWIPASWQDDPEAVDWSNGCQGGGGTISGYSASSVASISALVDTQNHEGSYSDLHNPELLLAVAWAWALETDPVKKAALSERISLIENWFNAECADSSSTPRSFNWQLRDGSVAYTMLPAGSISAGITVNDQPGPLTIARGSNLAVKITLTTNGDNTASDWWFAVQTSAGDWYHFDLGSQSWQSGLQATYQGELIDLDSYPVFYQPANVPPGSYTLYFGVDLVQDGQPTMEKLSYDSTEITIQ